MSDGSQPTVTWVARGGGSFRLQVRHHGPTNHARKQWNSTESSIASFLRAGEGRKAPKDLERKPVVLYDDGDVVRSDDIDYAGVWKVSQGG